MDLTKIHDGGFFEASIGNSGHDREVERVASQLTSHLVSHPDRVVFSRPTPAYVGVIYSAQLIYSVIAHKRR